MQRTRSHSAEPPRLRQPVASNSASATPTDANQLGIRILALKTLPLKQDERLHALFQCASEIKRLPQDSLPFFIGELVDACATLPSQQELRALTAVFGYQKPTP